MSTLTDDWTIDDAESMEDILNALVAHMTGRVALADQVPEHCAAALLASEIGTRLGKDPEDAYDWAWEQIKRGATVTLKWDEDTYTVGFEFDEAETTEAEG